MNITVEFESLDELRSFAADLLQPQQATDGAKKRGQRTWTAEQRQQQGERLRQRHAQTKAALEQASQ